MRSIHQGFTLIELLIVIAIIGILAAIAIPAYMDYTIRAEVSEGASLADGIETAFAANYATTGNAASSNAALGIPTFLSGTYVTSASLDKGGAGQIAVFYGNDANPAISGQTVYWTAYKAKNGELVWVCGDGASATDTIAQLKAAGGGAIGVAAKANTIADAAYLPAVCQ